MEIDVWPWLVVALGVTGLVVLAFLLGMEVGEDRARRPPSVDS